MGNSGTSVRFLLPILMLLKGEFRLSGQKEMEVRPMKDLLDVLLEQGVVVDYLGQHGFLPIHVKTNARFPGAQITINGQQTSQFISALLLVSPYATNTLSLRVTLKFTFLYSNKLFQETLLIK